jgi:hypothetical protein
MEQVDAQQILQSLQEHDPMDFARHAHLLNPATSPEHEG